MLGLHGIGLLFMPDRFVESGIKNALDYSVYNKPGNQTSDTISYQNNFIMSNIFNVFIA